MTTRQRLVALATAAALLLAACGSGGSDDEVSLQPVVSVTYGIKQVRFSWPVVPGATHYKLWERIHATAEFNQIGADLTSTSASHYISLHRRVNATYRIDACSSAGCTASDSINLAPNLVPAVGYFKSSNPDGQQLTDDFGDAFGNALALSADGDTMAVGEYLEDGAPGGVGSGAVYIFVRSAGNWELQAYLKASNAGGGFLCHPRPDGDQFGYAIALSADGNTLAVGAPGEDSQAIDINGDQSDNAAHNSGAVYVFTRSAGVWTQQAYVKGSNTEGGSFFCAEGDLFGSAVTLSADGNTLAVGAPGEDSQATGINGSQLDNSAESAGAVYLFTRTGDTWTQQAYVKASNPGASDQFGNAIALSGDGQTLAVAAHWEDSATAGINGDQADNSAADAGAVYVFVNVAGSWSQQAYVKASNAGPQDLFGQTVALSADGNTMAIAAPWEDGFTSGINGLQTDESAPNAGAVYVYVRSAGAWMQHAYIKASNTDIGDRFGSAIAVSADGQSLAIGALGESSNAVGVGGPEADNSAPAAGAVYLFVRSAGSWLQQAYVKASNSERADLFGSAVALNADGSALAVGARGEDGHSAGIGGNQSTNGAQLAGAVYLY